MNFIQIRKLEYNVLEYNVLAGTTPFVEVPLHIGFQGISFGQAQASLSLPRDFA